MTSSSGLLTQRSDAGLLLRYRIMAYATGVMLAFCCLVAWPLEHLAGVKIMWVPWMLHGWFFIVYVLTAVDLGLRRRWSLVKLAIVVAAGTIPFLVFFVEHRINKEEPAGARI
jgi:integral membrane protein